MDYHRCGVINKRWVLTAAPCIDIIDVFKLSVYIGMEHYSPNAIYQDKVKIKRIIIHPYWDNPPSDPDVIFHPPFRINYDIALLELVKETVSNDFAIINGINKDLDLPEGTEVTVIGMGNTKLGQTSEYLRKTVISIANSKRCIEIPSG
ncbi:MAG: trypsin-like serine protease [Candidatus Phlomobacter fragariae]